MTNPIEAHSLSSLANLFANPPQYPRNPTHEARDPLTLYIVRVPGSKDVFLTPLKPPAKTSISLEAISSCLYYLHVVTPEDELLRKSLGDQQRSEDAETAASAHNIIRKPLPSAPFANYPSSERPPIPPKGYPHYQPPSASVRPDTQAARHAARGTQLRLNTSAESGNIQQPLGPRSFQPRLRSDSGGSIKRKPVASPTCESVSAAAGISSLTEEFSPSADLDLRLLPGLPPPENAPLSSSARAAALRIRSGAVPDCALREGRDHNIHSANESPPPTNSTNITLIRRDPSSLSQWNVGTISFPTPRVETSSDDTERFVYVELTTPGYKKFAAHTSHDLTAKAGLSAEQIKRSLDLGDASSPSDISRSPPTNKNFIRQVQLQVADAQTSGMHSRGASDDLITSLKQSFSKSATAKSNPKFAFMSPWSGSCNFSTGLDGRSIKCRHILTSVSPAEENLGCVVANLKFNLPWLFLGPRKLKAPASPSAEGQLPSLPSQASKTKKAFRRSLQHVKHKNWREKPFEAIEVSQGSRAQAAMNSQEDMAASNCESDSRMDLKLGRENAGGGFTGKNAKLGKLIIEDEGLKMADLVVAACMGIWWQQYGISTGER